jgi:uncharacterized protein YjiS (DUF1127 family)
MPQLHGDHAFPRLWDPRISISCLSPDAISAPGKDTKDKSDGSLRHHTFAGRRAEPPSAACPPCSSPLVSGLISWNDARVTRGSLARLTDRELDDIGLCRGDIDEVAARLAR